MNRYAIIQEAQRQEELRLKLAMSTNTFERALNQMMGGTLEKRAEIEDEFNINPPQWLNDEPSTLTEEQAVEVCFRDNYTLLEVQ